MSKDVYACDGTTFEFPVTFDVDTPADVVVFLTTDATGETRRMVRNQDYTVYEEDGELTVITRVDDYRDPWPAGVTLTILRRMSFTQPSGRAGMSVKVFQNRVNSLTSMYQQLEEKLDRTLHVGQRYPAYALISDVLEEEEGGGPSLGANLIALCMDGTQRVATSDDGGETWTLRHAARGGALNTDEIEWMSLEFAPTLGASGRVGAVGDSPGSASNDYNFMYSDDFGETWTGVDTGASGEWRSIKWIPDDGGFFIIGAESSVSANVMYKSATGEVGSWSVVDLTSVLGASDNIADIEYIPTLQRIVAYVNDYPSGGTDDGAIIYSDDFGATWAKVVPSGLLDADGFGTHSGVLVWNVADSKLIVADSSGSAFAPPKYAHSSDGASWSAAANTTFSNNGDCKRGCYIPSIGKILISADGGINTSGQLVLVDVTTFGARQTPVADKHWYALGYDASRERVMMISAGRNGNSFGDDVLMCSDDGSTWSTISTMPAARQWTAVIAAEPA